MTIGTSHRLKHNHNRPSERKRKKISHPWNSVHFFRPNPEEKATKETSTNDEEQKQEQEQVEEQKHGASDLCSSSLVSLQERRSDILTSNGIFVLFAFYSSLFGDSKIPILNYNFIANGTAILTRLAIKYPTI